MKRLLIKSAALILLTAVLLFLGGRAYCSTNHYYNMEVIDGTEKFHAIPTSIDIAAFGSSHGLGAFQAMPEHLSFFNFSMTSQTPQYDECLMREYGNRFHDHTVVLLTVSYISPYWTETEELFAAKQDRYYRILHLNHLIRPDVPRYCLQRLSPLIYAEFPEAVKAFLQPETRYVSGPDDTVFRVQDADINRSRIEKDHLSMLKDRDTPAWNPDMWEAYCRMLNACRDNGWDAVLITPPYTSVYNDCFSEDFYTSFVAAVSELAACYEIPYLDYSHSPLFTEDFSLFRDCDHLNYTGSSYFDTLLLRNLQELGFPVFSGTVPYSDRKPPAV